jgi:HlyD family secretion protein
VNDRVVPGQVLAEINTDVIEDQITQARANLNAARAQVEQARATLEVDRAQLARFREVFEISGGRVPSQVELEQAQAAVRRGSAAVASAQASVRAAEAQLSSAVTNRNRAVVRSPVAGIVLARQVEPGQTVAASFSTPTLFIIAEDLSEMQLQVAIDEADVGQVEEGQQASFTVDAYPGRRFPAVVERVDQASSNTASEASQQANPSARANAVVSYEARLAVNNPQGLLRPGMTATATIATQSTGRRMLVPNSALRFRPEDAEQDEGGGVLNPSIGLEQNEQRATIGVGSRQQVYVPQADGTLEAIEVVTGQSDGRLTVVRSDALKAGMEVVTGIEADAP